MQTIGWYASRLQAMSCGEICWRLSASGRGVLDRLAYLRRRRLPAAPRLARLMRGGRAWRAEPAGPLVAAEGIADVPALLLESRSLLLERAERNLESLDLFGLYRCEPGPALRWNYDYSSLRATPLRFATGIDYRDFSEVGDAKVVWELNRHQHLVVLARAYRFTRQRRYAAAVIDALSSWMRECPYGTGMAWRSPLELAVRLINWVWALEFIAPSGLPWPEDARTIEGFAYRHLWEIARNYSRYSSANNHLVGEAAGVFIGASLFSGLRGASRWRSEARDILCREIGRQTHQDGGHCELAMGYHVFVLEFFLLAGLVGRRCGCDFPQDYWDRLERMFEFLAAFAEGGDALPMLGDSDDGFVLDLGRADRRAQELLAVGAALYGRGDFKAVAGGLGETAYWLLGAEGVDRFARTPPEPQGDRIVSRAFPQSGYYLLQHGHRHAPDRVSVTFDCGELGFGAIAAHGHADALSFTLRAFGTDVCVDPGTYDYFTYPDWRNHFRSTRAHNTVAVDGRDQSEMRGPFLWGRRAQARCVEWHANPRRTAVTGEVDSGHGVLHRRRLVLDHLAGQVLIRDELCGRGDHTAEVYFHFDENCLIEPAGEQRYKIDCGRGTLFLELDPRFSITLYRGCPVSRLGWVSRSYHRKTPAVTLAASCPWRDALVTVCRMVIGRPAGLRCAGSEPLDVPSDRERELEEVCHGTD